MDTPDVPTLVELGFKELEATGWVGFLTTAGTPHAAVERYSRELVKILRTREMINKLRAMQFDVIASTPAQFNAWIRTEIVQWGKVVKATGAKVE